MNRNSSLVLTALLVMVFASWSYSQVNVDIPDLSGNMGETVTIPVNVGSLTGLGVISYQFRVTFNENILDATGVTTSGTLSEAGGWSIIPNTNNNGEITVGGFGFTELSGSGTLIKLNFTVVGNPTETTNLNFAEFVFNGGTPSSSTSGGLFTVTGTLINITVTTSIGAGTKVYMDGVQKNAPFSTQWYANTSHTIGVDTEQSGGTGIKYIYNSWSQGGSQTQTVTPTTVKTYTANLDTKYYLTVTSAHDSPLGTGWYNAGTTANFSVTTPAEESGGSRYRFTNWTGDFTGTNSSASITMNAPKTVTANWLRQYYLTTVENPAAGGDISPTPPGAWYDTGTNASVDAAVAGGYLWRSWSGDLSGTSKPTTILMNGPKSVTANFDKIIQVTIQTNPAGREFLADGSTYSSTQVFNWAENSQHTLSVTSPQNGATGVRYMYSSWSDGGAQSHNYVVPGSNQTVTANFTTQYYLTVTSTHDSPQGQGWYNSNAAANFSVTTPADETNGTRYAFANWSGAYSGTSTSGSVTMNQPKEVIANWTTQYYLTVTSSHDSPQGQGWYNSDATANFSVTSPANEANGTRYVFTQWSGNYSGTSTSGNVTMSSAKEVIANWKTQYFLTTAENPAAGGDVNPLSPGAWYDSGTNAQVDATVASNYQWAGWSGDLSGTTKPTTILMTGPKSVTANFGRLVQITIQSNPIGREFLVDGTTYSVTQVFNWAENSQHTLSVTSPQNGATGVRYMYSSWSDGGAQSHNYVVPGNDQTVMANFTTQYYLTVTSSHDTPQGQAWYNSGATANFSVTTPADETNGTRYAFANWSGAYSGTSSSGSVTMNQPKEVIANWTTQYYLTVTSVHDAPQGQGWYNSGATANFSVTSPANEANGTRYVFTQWSGNYSGTSTSGSVTMSSGKEVIANWKTQYFLTTAENPAAGGDVNPLPPGAWYESNTNAQVDASVASNYQWAGWSGDLSGTTRPTNILMNGSKSVTANFSKLVQITIQANPVGREFQVDGSTYSATQVFNWLENSQHALSVISPQTGATGVRFTYSTWSDGGAQSHNYVVPGNSQTVTANFTTQYYLTVTSSHDSPQGEGWYNSNATANFGVTSPADEANGMRYLFANWSGGFNGTSPAGSVTMNQPKEIIANWTLQYYLKVISAHDTPQGQAWYNSGVTANFSVTSPANAANGIRYAFTQWSGSYSGTGASGSVTMSSAKEVVANWKTQYLLTTAENPDEGGDITPAPPGAWYDNGENASVSAVIASNYEWGGWTGDLSGTTNPVQILMNSPKTITANFTGNESISSPNRPSGPSSGIIGQNMNYTTGGSVSSLGHNVEYKFNWGDGSESDWGSATRNHSYSNKGNYSVRAKARCSAHINVVSAWSDTRVVSIGAYSLNVIVNPVEAGSVQKTRNKVDYSYNETVQLKAIASSGGYAFNRWSEDLTGSSNPQNIVMNGNKNVIAIFDIEVITTPNKPTGPGNAVAGEMSTFRSGGANSNLGHNLQYQFDFGDGNLSNWITSSADYAYTNVGTYSVRARARCAEHQEIMSGWSSDLRISVSGLILTVPVNPDSAGDVEINPLKDEYNHNELVQIRALPVDGSWEFDFWSGDIETDNINPRGVWMRRDREIIANFLSETISAPVTLSGPPSSSTQTNVSFTAGGSASSFGHDVEYQFDWGNGTLSPWGGNTQIFVYQVTGNHYVRARARCVDHPRVISQWSDAVQIMIADYSLTVQIDPAGAGTVNLNPAKNNYTKNEIVGLFAIGQTNYYFSRWSGDLTGTVNPTTINMDTNKAVTAHFNATAETVSKPTFINGPTQGKMGRTNNFSTGGSVNNLGNGVEYQFDWGDGISSGWDSPNQNYTYMQNGTFQVRSRGRSSVNTSVVSQWSNPKSIAVTGHKLTVSVQPDTFGQVIVTPSLSEYAENASVRLAPRAVLGYSFDHWTGDLSGNANPVTIIMTGDKNITAHFSDAVESVSTPNVPVGLANGIIGQNLIFVVDGAVNSFGYDVEYQYSWGDSTLSMWGAENRSHVYFAQSIFLVKAKARSKVHPDIMSDWSEPLSVAINGLNLDVRIEPEQSGFVTRSPYKIQYAYQDTVVLRTASSQLYLFDHWFGDLTGDNNPSFIVMNGNKSISAFFIEKQEVISKPDSIIGPQIGYRGQALSFTAHGSVSNFGNNVQYQFEWGDGSLSGWGSRMQTKVYPTSGGFILRARAQSVVDAKAISEWSDGFNVNITGCKLIVAIDPENSGDVVKYPNQTDYYYGAAVVLSAIGNSDYKFTYWNDFASDTLATISVFMTKDTTIVANFKKATFVSEKKNIAVPAEYSINQNYPNPFNPDTRIDFQLPENSFVKISIFNICGQMIRVLTDEEKAAGYHSVLWNGWDESGNKVPSGIYLYRIETTKFQQVKKMLLLR